jgi:hypothetical protein
MYFDHMIDLELHVHFIVATMADALATIHWGAKIDGQNVEFVLGGVPGDDEAFLPPSCKESEVLIDQDCNKDDGRRRPAPVQ